MDTKVTVFMAAYNAETYISESIKSILTQTFYDFELLIVNDGSTDRTVDIINEFKDNRIRLINNKQNEGLVYTRNVCLKEAKGTYIAVLDSDDLAVPDRLEQQYNFFSAHPEFALCGGHGVVINKGGLLVNDNRLTVPIEPLNIKMTLLFLNTFVNSTVMYKTAVLRELEGYKDFAPAEDYELFIRIADKYPVANLDRVLVKYRDHGNNISVIEADKSVEKVLEIKKIQLQNMDIPTVKKTVDTFYSLLKWNFSTNDLADYLLLLGSLKIANKRLKKYPERDFEKMLFNYWFLIIFTRKTKMNALFLLFNKALFKWSFLTAKQFRKAFKLSLKGFGRLST
jgi:glycosyltransferase involved in cell wall biosynthesis